MKPMDALRIRRLLTPTLAAASGAATGGADSVGGMRGDRDLNPGMAVRRTHPLPAAVMAIIVLHRGAEPTLLLTRRADHLHDHAGQIALPGGRIEEADGPLSEPDIIATSLSAALRETGEETGIAPARIEPVGRLDPYLSRTGYLIYPWVGLLQAPYRCRPDPAEVAEVFEVPLAFILRRSNHRISCVPIDGQLRRFVTITYGTRRIWGVTAGILANLTDILCPPPQSTESPVPGENPVAAERTPPCCEPS